MEQENIKKKFSYIGVCYWLFMMLSFMFRQISRTIVSVNNIELNDWGKYLISMIPLWGMAFPIFYLLIRRVPKSEVGNEKRSLLGLLKIYPMSLMFIFAGSIIGNIIAIIASLITKTTIKNSVISTIMGRTVLASFVFACVMAPIFEELAFRKILIDRVGQYSQKYAIILSGVLFGLFHGNVFQIFYATALGMIFAYVYIKSGRVYYTMILHGIINFMHGVFPMLFMKKLNIDEILKLSQMDPNDPETIKKVIEVYSDPNFLAYLGWVFFIFALAVLGIVLLILQRKKIKLDESKSIIQEKKYIPDMFINTGMALFAVGTLFEVVYSILSQVMK